MNTELIIDLVVMIAGVVLFIFIILQAKKISKDLKNKTKEVKEWEK